MMAFGHFPRPPRLSGSGGDGAAIAFVSGVGHTVQAESIHLLAVLAVVIYHFQDRDL